MIKQESKDIKGWLSVGRLLLEEAKSTFKGEDSVERRTSQNGQSRRHHYGSKVLIEGS